MGQPRAIIAPIHNEPVGIPSSARKAFLRSQRFIGAVEQFFDPYDIQSYVFESGWKETPGVSRLLIKTQRELKALTQQWPDWTLSDSSFGLYSPFFAEVFEPAGIQPEFELPVWPVAHENMGRYVHRFLTSAAASFRNLSYSQRGGSPPAMDSSSLPIVRETIELARRALDGTADHDRIREAHARWIRMGVVRNSYHKPGTVTLHGQSVDGSEVLLTAPTRVSRSWTSVEFNVRLKPGQEARLIFRPALRPAYLRFVRAEGADRSWPVTLGAGGSAEIEPIEDEVMVFVAYPEGGYVRFVVPRDVALDRLAFQLQIRDDPVAQLEILDGLTQGRM